MDGLLLDSERISLQIWKDVCLPAAPSLDENVFLRMIGHKWEDCLQLLCKAMPGQEELAMYLACTAQERYLKRASSQPIPVKPGVVKILEHFRKGKVPCAVATSTAKDLALQKLRNAGLIDYFAAVAGGDEVEHGKPAPDIFRLAARRLGVRPSRCMAFEDSEPGIRGAHAARMATILIPDIRMPGAVVAECIPRAVLGSIDRAIQFLPID